MASSSSSQSSIASDRDMEVIEQHRIRRRAPRPRIFRDRSNPMEIYDEIDFKRRFRFSKATFMELVRLIGPALERRTSRSRAINAELQILVCLRFYATGAFQLTVADHINISVSSVCRIVKDVTHRIAALSPDYIKMPNNQEEMDAVAAKFHAIRGLPGVLGAIDCTHIKIISPGGDNAERFRNRKGFYSINTQVICDADLMIRDIIARWPGSTHDSTIFQDSQIPVDFERGVYGHGVYGHGRYLLGDGGYACKAYLLTPVAHPQTDAEERYNVAHASTRNPIERCFGLLKRRFPCLFYGLRNKVDLSVVIIVACSVLHNFALMHRDADVFDEDIREIPAVALDHIGGIAGQQDYAVRNAVIAAVFT